MSDNFMSLDEMLSRYGTVLSRYCKIIAGSSWDAEDLYQTVLAKIYRQMSTKQGLSVSKAYLFRVATNAWIDICRRQKFSWDELEDHHCKSSSSPAIVRESMEELLDKLTPQQACILLLSDIFLFSPGETAEMVRTTAGAVKAVLHRARTRMKATKVNNAQPASPANIRELIEIFIDAFRNCDPEAICRAYNSLKNTGYEVTPVMDAQVLYFRCKDPEGNVFVISEEGKAGSIIKK